MKIQIQSILRAAVLLVSCGISAATWAAPNCKSSASDPDGDGWGWENNQSCIVVGGGSSSASGSCPSNLQCSSGLDCGCEIISGLGRNKQAYKDAGANLDFLASAMMETKKMDTNYTYGDGKKGFMFNAGATKQNWRMMKQCNTEWKYLGENDYAYSDDLNWNRSFDVQVYKKCRAFWGDKWFAGHRSGQTGLDNPNTRDNNTFKNAHAWIKKMLQNNQTNDVRFYVRNLPAK
jgi:hypothetical protein